MSILIKGMEMPTSCGDCPIGDSLCCSLMPGVPALWKEYTIAVRTNRRHSDCPLVRVPPHGRLIDADALDDAFTELRWDSEGLVHWGDRNAWCLSGNEVEKLFNNAPTIIPADKDVVESEEKDG